MPADGPEPGPWRTDRVPYAREILRAFSDPRHDLIVVCMATQMAKTEIILNLIGHTFDEGPLTPTLYVGPTEKHVRSMSSDRFAKLLRSTPSLAAKLAGGQLDKVSEKIIAGTRLGFAWAGSGTELRSHPCGRVYVDERDAMEALIGEGDPLELARARTSNYPGSKVGVFSTPTLWGQSEIWKLAEEGTLETWSWRCIGCDDAFAPRLGLFVYDADATRPELAERGAGVACPGCGTMHYTQHQRRLNDGGLYVPHQVSEDGETHEPVDLPRDTRTRSFVVSGLASPWRTFEVVAHRLAAARLAGDQQRELTIVNTLFGEPYRLRGDRPDASAIEECRRPYSEGMVPDAVQMITAGADVQQDGIYYVVRGWGFNEGSWLLRHGYIPGQTEFDSVWLLLARALFARFPGDRVVQRVFVDSGYRPGDRRRRPEHQVYLFARRHAGRVFPTKGRDAQDLIIRAALVDVNLAGRVVKGGVQLWHLDTDRLKTWLYARYVWPESDVGGWYLPQEVDEDYLRQVVAEEVVNDPKTHKRRWVRRSRANHYLDCEVNARAAALSLGVESLPETPPPPVPGTVCPAPAPPPGGWVKRPEGSFFGR